VTSDRNTRGTRPLSPTFGHFLAPAITATLVPLVMEYVVRARLADTVSLSGDRLNAGPITQFNTNDVTNRRRSPVTWSSRP